MRYTLLFLLSLSLLTCATVSVPSQIDPATDSAIRFGRFANGFTYLVRPNKKPENRAHLSLVVRAGSLHEEDDERGLAHFVEHMAFNGTKRFAQNEIVQYFEKIGMRFGDGLNAYTSFEETVYFLEIPMDKPDILEKSFQILVDWSRDLSFDPAMVEREKGVIEEEWRLGRDVNGRRRDVVLPELFNRTRYAERLPIGQMEVVKAATPEKLRRFFQRWYRPERMALIAVGDFDPELIVQQIRQGFEGWTNPTPAPVEVPVSISPYPSRDYVFFNDPEQPYNIVQFTRMQPVHSVPWRVERRADILAQMTKGALDQRLSVLTQAEDPPFLSAFYDRSNFVRRFLVRSLYVVIQPNQQARGVEAALREVERLRRFGFTPREWEREKNAILQELEILLARQDDRTHAEWAEDMTNAFLKNQVLPSISTYVHESRKILDELSLDELVSFAKEDLNLEQNKVIVLTNTTTGNPPKRQDLEAVVAQLPNWQFDRFEVGSIQQLVPNPPAPVAIVDTRTWPQLELTQWTLSNGTQVFWKKTNFKQEEVLIRAFRPGGLSLASNTELNQAAWTVDLLSESGLGNWSHTQLLDFLADKNISVDMSVDEAAAWISGSAATRHLETWFQFLFLRLTQLNPTPTSFRSVQGRMVNMAQARQANPEQRFMDFVTTLLRGGPTRSRVLTPEAIQAAQLEKVQAWDRRLFGSGEGWVFVIVGDIPQDSLENLVRVYLGNLPRGERERPVDRQAVPNARGNQVLRAGQEQRARVYMVYPFQGEFSIQELVNAQALVEIVNIRLRNRIREEAGETYSIRFDFQYRPKPNPNGFSFIQFGSSVARHQDIMAQVKRELDLIRQQGVTSDEVKVFQEIRYRDLESAQRQNQFWASNISSYLFNERDLNQLPRFLERVRAVTPTLVKEAAQRLLNLERGFEAILLPQTP